MTSQVSQYGLPEARHVSIRYCRLRTMRGAAIINNRIAGYGHHDNRQEAHASLAFNALA